MLYLKLKKDRYNDYESNIHDCATIEALILRLFLTDDVGCRMHPGFFQLVYDPEFRGGCSNATFIEKEDGYIFLSDGIGDPDEEPDPDPVKLKMTCEQYVHLLETWRDQVCKKMPNEVIIRYENGQFTFETK